MARLFADENYSLPTVEVLRQLGHDVATVQERGLGGKSVSDRIVLNLAISEQRAVLTFDRRDYFTLHREGIPHEGIFAYTFDANEAALAQRIHEAIEHSPLLTGQYIRIVKPRPSGRVKGST